MMYLDDDALRLIMFWISHVSPMSICYIKRVSSQYKRLSEEAAIQYLQSVRITLPSRPKYTQWEYFCMYAAINHGSDLQIEQLCNKMQWKICDFISFSKVRQKNFTLVFNGKYRLKGATQRLIDANYDLQKAFQLVNGTNFHLVSSLR